MSSNIMHIQVLLIFPFKVIRFPDGDRPDKPPVGLSFSLRQVTLLTLGNPMLAALSPPLADRGRYSKSDRSPNEEIPQKI